jgi:sialate O-acetylesterase
MEMGVGAANNGAAEIQNANFPQIRLFTLTKNAAIKPQTTAGGSWQVCTPATLGNGSWGGFSAVGYFFGRELNRKLNVPIGLIHTSWGGTVAEAWTSGEALKKSVPEFAGPVRQVEEVAARDGAGIEDSATVWNKWYQANDAGSAASPSWAAPEADTADWKVMPVVHAWDDAELPNFDGIVWLRKDIQVPAELAGRDAVLHLGAVDDNDTTFVNGTRIGATEGWQAARDYKLPAGTLKAGRNTIAVRVLDTGGGGGMYSPADGIKLDFPGVPNGSIPLGQDWLYKAGKPLTQLAALPLLLANNPNVPTVLYNGMIAPLVPFGVKGAIWYQGEANVGRAEQYQRLLPTMIGDWRQRFGQGDFPFYIVQLASYLPVQPDPTDSVWAQLRQAQANIAKKVINSGLAVAIDIGDADDIHPKNKQEVGRRLALNALALTYGQKIEYSGPVLRSFQIRGNQAVLAFDHAAGGLVSRGGDKLSGFAVGNKDGKWAWAEAKIQGETVTVSSPEISTPVAVSYAWADNPIANLTNKDGLPAVPFRTDRP